MVGRGLRGSRVHFFALFCLCQAEDGIRDFHVTGVQTCALPISVIRTHLFIPYILRHQICDESDVASALALAQQFEHLSYFPHALEILLHNVLDDEAGRDHGPPGNDNGEGIASRSMLPTVLSFLQTALSPESYLSTIVQCVRKTEISSWHTLFAHLPTPVALFEQELH